MAYPPFVSHSPTADHAGVAFCDETLDNLRALRDSVVTGKAPGWDARLFETFALWVNQETKEGIAALIILGTTGGADGMPELVAWQTCVNYEATVPRWIDMGREFMVYDVDGNITSITWAY